MRSRATGLARPAAIAERSSPFWEGARSSSFRSSSGSGCRCTRACKTPSKPCPPKLPRPGRRGTDQGRPVLLAAIIVAVFLISGAWLTVLLLPLPVWVGVAVTSFAVLLVLAVVAFRKVRAVTKAAALERELM